MVTVVPGTERELPADLVLLAIGFEGTDPGPLLDQLGLARGAGTIDCGHGLADGGARACSWPATCTGARR